MPAPRRGKAVAHGASAGETITTRIPGRMDRLPWSRWHWLVVFGLGTVWILDGVEVTIVGAIASRLQDKQTLGLSAFDIAFGGTCYIIGAAIGAIGFGYLTDRLGRKKLFIVTLAVYLVATVATAFTWSAASFWIFRAFTGLGIGGEYAAINSAIDELIPARARGWVDLAINGSYWLGASVGAALSFVLLDKSLFSIDLGWRLAFGLGAAMGLAIMFVRRNVPESPRWLTIHGREDEAEKLVSSIEERVKRDTGTRELDDPGDEIEIEPREATNVFEVGRTLFKRYPRRSILGFTLMATQAFIYNAVIFTFSIVLTTFFKVSDSAAPAYLIPFGIANFAGALLLGRFFDTVGRRPMITGTYFISAVGLFRARAAVQQRHARARRLHGRPVWDVLLRLRGGLGGLPDGQRGLPAGDARHGHRALLRDLDRHRRRRRTAPLRQPARDRRPEQPLPRLRHRLGPHARGRRGGLGVGRRRRAGVARGDRRAPVRDVGGGGMSRRVWSPGPLALSGVEPAGLAERETEAIVAVLRREGPLDTGTLRGRVEARLWGPGRFGPALRRAVGEGRVRRVGRRTWAAVD